MGLDTDDQRLPYQQIADTLRDEIRSGKLRPGDQLPTVVTLGDRFGVAKMTAEKALKELRDEGLIISWQGRGTFVRDIKVNDHATPTATGVDELATDIEKLKKQYGRLEGLLMHLYSRVGEPFPHDQERKEPKRRSA